MVINAKTGKRRKKNIPSCPLVANLKDNSDIIIIKKIITNKKILNLSKLSFSFDLSINRQLTKESSGRYNGL
tara:strand:+ start:302 stop:517 length:216 start_codon:yes stop_codon:yes gene_type:complete